MGIDRLRYFAAVVESGNLRKAAELVGIAPPSMSKAISVLEGELGVKLLRPDGRGIIVTESGMEIYRSSIPLLEEERRFYRRVREKSPSGRRMRLATFEVFSSHFMSALLTVERDLDPLVLEMVPGKIEQAILSRVVDFGLTYVPSADPDLEFTELGTFRMGIYGREEWLARDFASWPFAIPVTELNINSAESDSIDLWPKKGPRRLVKYRFELLETALQTAQNGLSVIHCPDFIAKLSNRRVDSRFKLSLLPNPARYDRGRPIRMYFISRRNERTRAIEYLFKRFVRSLA